MGQKDMTKHIKDLMDIFHKVGIAKVDRFDHVHGDNHPNTVLRGVQSAIVFAAGSSGEGMGEFDDYFGTIAAQTDVIDYLNGLGFKTAMIDNNVKHVSLVKMAIEAGVGELSPVDSVVVKGLGLTATLGVILTDAPLVADDKAEGVCIHCNICLRVCPIREKANEKGDLSKCSCGKCKLVCPV